VKLSTLLRHFRRRETCSPSLSPAVRVSILAAIASLALAGGAWAADGQDQDPAPPGDVVVYLLDHQFLPTDELATIQSEINRIFSDAGVQITWVSNASPRRRLAPNELRIVVLPSDGTRWFQGPSNIIGIAPHDDTGIGRNCFVFYRQAIWFRQQAVWRCRQAVEARVEASMRGIEVDPYIDSLAPEDCGERLPSLTALIVARAAAHEMVHILLTKLDHSAEGLMRQAFDINELWAVGSDAGPFRLTDPEILALRSFSTSSPGGSR
jgi:hypothetical protein